MEYINLGDTDLKVSRLCFGSLTISPLQAGLPVDDGADIILSAMDMGVNFIDTAEFYQNYRYINKALTRSKKDFIISTKSYAYTYEGMKKSVEKARKETGKDVIDIFMLHEQETRLTLKGHREALEYLVDARAKGLIKAIGVSTHTVEVVNAAADIEEIEVIHPIINFRGIGIKDGSLQDMEKAIERAYKNGKGIYAMKALGGGNLIGDKERAFSYILSFPYLHSVAVGMKSNDEVVANISIFEGKTVDSHIEKRLSNEKRKLLIEDWCVGCGECVKHCLYNALHIVNGHSMVNPDACILCGYCSGYCPEFCIKIL
ncbi:MAG: aldo/keto reductase [Tepidanaerobacter acetatoxydans]|uniref:aldo/keto reductase n=1 Tax=Tepidanaerobacter TaxID=499228 RepID=UPI000AE771CC|nr:MULTISPECIES: aldo/keto reductase [Tepidanaerobacter]NLU11404.1 aldo/keto reductase [Tepidanaerobacter acetatoxydans]